jgi:O-antigen/teichoic acid export membrane protein
MINKEKQIKNSLIYLSPKIITGFLPMITLPVFTRILSMSDYGMYALAEVYAIFLTGIVNFGLTASYERNFFQYADKRRLSQLLYSTLAFVLATFLAAVVFTFVFKKPISRVLIGSAEHSGLLFWVFLSTVIMSFKQYFLIYFKNTERAKDFVVYTLDETFLGVMLSLFFVVCLKSGIIGLAWGQCFASSLILSVLIVRFLKDMPLCFGWDVLKDSLKISLPLTPKIFMGVISTQFNKYILKLLDTLGGVGILSVAQRIANSSFIIMTALQNVFNPQVYKKMFSGELSAGRQIGEYLTPFVYISVFICLSISLFSDEIVRLLTGPSFYAAAPIISILSMYYGFLFFGKINGIQIIYKKKTYVSFIFTVMDIIVGVAISIPFISKFGVIGSAWATFFGGLIMGTVGLIVSQHYFYIHWEVKKMVAIYSVFCISSLLILFNMNGSVVYSVSLALKLFCLAFYVYLGVMLRIVTIQNFKLLRDIATFKKSSVTVNVDPPVL